MVRVVLALLAIAGLMMFFSKLGRLSGPERAAYLKRAAIYGAVGLVLLMVVTGRAPALFALAAAVIPWMQRAMLLRNLAGGLRSMGIKIPGLGGVGNAFGSGPASGESIEFSRDHASGRLTGRVLKGRFAGSALDTMNLTSLLLLREELEANDPAAEVEFVKYLDATFEDWRPASKGVAANNAPMTYSEALEVLGLEAGASQEEIVEAHRKLIAKVHPDRGGVDWMATKLNQARDVLLGPDSRSV